jgi:gamma-glutamyltranspeptidase/glutathione hydrolase
MPQAPPFLYTQVVATSQPLAARAGLDALRRGGNAVDAALSAAIALTVVEPTGCGVGGDAFAMVWDGRRLWGLNGSGRSPAAWNPQYFAKRGALPELGWDTVTVPGAVDAWAVLSERFGALPFEALFVPALDHARNGYSVTPNIALKWREAETRYRAFPDFAHTFLPGGRAPRAGERFRCPDLAGTLEKIAATRGEAFYRGEISEKIAARAIADGAAMTLRDLADHRSQWVAPLSRQYGDIRLHELPPNGQGIAALIALGILDQMDLAAHPMDGADSIHLQVEAMKIAFEQTFRHVADPDAMTITAETLLENAALSQMARSIRLDRAADPQGKKPDEGGTVTLAAADSGGMMVSYIQSNYLGFGSGIVIPGTGISLQNRGCGFTPVPGHPNRVDGAKRPFHTIIPAFVTRGEDRPVLSLGVMGAHMQAQGHVQIVTRMFTYGLGPQAACDAPRWHVGKDWALSLENGFDPEVVNELRRRGHPIAPSQEESLFGGAQLVMNTDAGYLAGSDHRKDGEAVGF